MLNNEPIPNPVDKLPRSMRHDLDKNLCTCMDVPKIKIINAIANGAHTVADVRKETYATMGSKCCVQQVERLIELICKPEPRKRRTKRRAKAQS